MTIRQYYRNGFRQFAETVFAESSDIQKVHLWSLTTLIWMIYLYKSGIVWLRQLGFIGFCLTYECLCSHNPPMDILTNANTVPKLVEFLCDVSASKPNVLLFPWFFTNHGFLILALTCNLNFHGLSLILHHPKLLWVLQLWLDSFICGLASSSCRYFGKFDLFLYVNLKIL